MIERLMRLDTSAISDAMDRLELSCGVVAALEPVTLPSRIAGRVVTVTLEEARGRRSVDHLGTRAIDGAQPGDVIVVSHRDAPHISGWGGLLSLAALLRGVAGVVIDGACRDVDEVAELGFPIYARSTTPRTARARVIETAWNEPISVGGVTVTPGDYVVADRTGVVFIPAETAERVVDAAESIYAREAAMARALRAGASVREALLSYEGLLVDAK